MMLARNFLQHVHAAIVTLRTVTHFVGMDRYEDLNKFPAIQPWALRPGVRFCPALTHDIAFLLVILAITKPSSS